MEEKRKMYNITNEERATIHNNMVKLFEEYDYNYTHNAIDTIIDEWCENKQRLIEAFKTHPNYVDGKFLIAFESNYERQIDVDAIYNFTNYICRLRVRQERIDNLPKDIDKQRRREHCSYLPNELYYWLGCNFGDIKTRTINENTANEINRMIPNIRAKAGEKTTRVINKLLTYLNYNQDENYNREYAKYADALTPMTIKRHTILSINPIDYLTMSFGNSWSSCHTIDKRNKRKMPNGYEGQYSSGTMSYMLDSTSMVFYTVDAKYDKNDFYFQDKINRQMFHYGEDKLIQGRLYPQSNDGASDYYKQNRNIVQGIISNSFNFPNLWIKKSDDASEYTSSIGTHYRDYEHFSDCNVSIIKSSDNTKYVRIGHDPICIECGEEHDDEENINCCSSGRYYCNHCGCTIGEDDVIWLDGEPYCSDCVVWCEHCEEYCLYDDSTYINNYGYVCDSCRDNYFSLCDECEEWHHDDRMSTAYSGGRELYVCEHCLDSYYSYCEDCDEYYRTNEMHEDEDGTLYCEDCWQARMENEENEENETEDE